MVKFPAGFRYNIDGYGPAGDITALAQWLRVKKEISGLWRVGDDIQLMGDY